MNAVQRNEWSCEWRYGWEQKSPPRRTVATFVAEGKSLRTTQGVGVYFCPKNHDNHEAHSTAQASLSTAFQVG